MAHHLHLGDLRQQRAFTAQERLRDIRGIFRLCRCLGEGATTAPGLFENQH